jgi:glycine cleavage system H lipoate-binding protein
MSLFRFTESKLSIFAAAHHAQQPLGGASSISTARSRWSVTHGNLRGSASLEACKDAKVQQDESYLSNGDLLALNTSSFRRPASHNYKCYSESWFQLFQILVSGSDRVASLHIAIRTLIWEMGRLEFIKNSLKYIQIVVEL